MKVVAFDTETALFRPGVMAPEIACVTWQRPGAEPQIAHWTESEALIRTWLKNKDTVIVGHNVPYDIAVVCAQWPDLLPLFFQACDEDRVTDTMIRQKLLDIAGGCYRGRFDLDSGKWQQIGYSLFDLTRRHTGRILDKDQWRLRYGEFRDVPLNEWPEGARIYPLEDARATLDCYLAQEAHKEFLEPQFHETRSALMLHLISVWGLRTSPEKVAELAKETAEARAAVFQELLGAGLVRKDGSRDTKKAKTLMVQACEASGKRVRLTDSGNVQLDEDACLYSGEPLLESYAEYSTLSKVESNDLPALAGGVKYPVHTRFDIAGTGRTTSANPNVQNPRRLKGVRECFVPREGFVFIDADYNALELWSLAQTCLFLFGKSHLAEVLNAGKDPHTALAADILGISYEEAAKRKKNPDDKEFDSARQTAKVGNFGLPGGMSANTFVEYAWKSYGVRLEVSEAQRLRDAWFNRWPEMNDYFTHVKRLMNNPEGEAIVEIPILHMFRGGLHFTNAANTGFQGLGAAAAKHAGWLIAKACYVDKKSPLYGSRSVNFVHDQFLTETWECPQAHDAAYEMARLMKEGARKFLPDCVPGVEPLLCRRWSKSAKAVFDSNGRLIPWEDK